MHHVKGMSVTRSGQEKDFRFIGGKRVHVRQSNSKRSINIACIRGEGRYHICEEFSYHWFTLSVVGTEKLARERSVRKNDQGKNCAY